MIKVFSENQVTLDDFYFSLDEDRIGELPEQLVRQASSIAQKVIRELIHKS